MTKQIQTQAEQFVDDVFMVSQFDQGNRPVAAMSRDDTFDAATELLKQNTAVNPLAALWR